MTEGSRVPQEREAFLSCMEASGPLPRLKFASYFLAHLYDKEQILGNDL